MLKNAFNNKKVLVLGHTGFKGTWMSMWLQSLGAEVVGISDRIPTEPSHFEAVGLDRDLRTHYVDIREHDKLVEVIIDEKPDFVFHMAAQALVKESYENPVETLAINAIGTANVLEGLRGLTNPCTAVLITSDKCYYNIEQDYSYSEDDRLGGADPYSASKAAAELVIASYVQSYLSEPDPIRIGITRAGNVVGGGDWAANRLVPDIARAWSKGEKVTIRRPQSTRPWQHVLEPISGYLVFAAHLAASPKLHGEAFNFGPPDESVGTVLDVVTSLQQHLPNLDLDVDESQANFHEAGLLKVCSDKAAEHLNWKAVFDFDETMSFTAQWYEHYYTKGVHELKQYTENQLASYAGLAKQRGLEWAQVE